MGTSHGSPCQYARTNLVKDDAAGQQPAVMLSQRPRKPHSRLPTCQPGTPAPQIFFPPRSNGVWRDNIRYAWDSLRVHACTLPVCTPMQRHSLSSWYNPVFAHVSANNEAEFEATPPSTTTELSQTCRSFNICAGQHTEILLMYLLVLVSG